MVCELVEGARPLDEAWRSLDRLGRIRLLRDVAAGVAAAHAAGIVHRDLKPENVLVDVHGRARVADFGVAYSESLERLTRTGAAVGTPSFMAPEQLTGTKEPTAACDVWALGVLLFLALADELPFSGGSMLEFVARVASGASTEHKRLLADSPAPLRRLVLDCLRADPSQRPREAGVVRASLEAWLDDPGAGAPRRAAAVACAVGVLVALGAGVASLFLSRGEAPAVETPSRSEPEVSPTPGDDDLAALALELEGESELSAVSAAQQILRRFPERDPGGRAKLLLRKSLWRPVLTLRTRGEPLGRLIMEPSLRVVSVSKQGELRVWRPDQETQVRRAPSLGGLKVRLDALGRLLYTAPQGEVRDGVTAVGLGGVCRIAEDGEETWLVERSRVVSWAEELERGRLAIGGLHFAEIRRGAETLARADLPGEFVLRFVPLSEGLICLSATEQRAGSVSRLRFFDHGLEPLRDPLEVAGHNARIVPNRDESQLLIANFHYSRLEVFHIASGRRQSVFSPVGGGWRAGSMLSVAWAADQRRALVLIRSKARQGRVECWDTLEGQLEWGRDLPRLGSGHFVGPGPDFLVLGLEDRLQVMPISAEKP